MLKKTITYTDYDGNERTEDFFFNLSKAEVLEMEMGVNGGMTKLIQRLVAEQDMERISKTFKEIIMKAYGEKSLDGKYFEKSPRTLPAVLPDGGLFRAVPGAARSRESRRVHQRYPAPGCCRAGSRCQ